MRIAIPAQGQDLNNLMCAKFGCSPYFLFCDSEDPLGTVEYRTNPSIIGTDGAGIVVAEYMARENVKIIIASKLGHNALRIIRAVKIPTYSAPETMTLMEAIMAWKEGILTSFDSKEF